MQLTQNTQKDFRLSLGSGSIPDLEALPIFFSRRLSRPELYRLAAAIGHNFDNNVDKGLDKLSLP
jgi:hypothetical protein